MDSFKQLLSYIGVYEQGVDFIKQLPTEISQIILSKLDTQSLYNASQVSRSWLSVCKSTSTFRGRIRRSIRRRNRQLSRAVLHTTSNLPDINTYRPPIISTSQPKTYLSSTKMINSKSRPQTKSTSKPNISRQKKTNLRL